MRLSNIQYSEATAKLNARKDSIILDRIGLISLNKPPFISGILYQAMAKVCAAQCLLDGLACTEEGLCLRNLNPYHDLLWGNNEERHNECYSYEWRQPLIRVKRIGGYEKLVGEGYNREVEGISHAIGNMFIAYRTNRDVDNTQKVIVLLGAQNVNPTEECWVQRIEACISNIKVITELDLSLIKSRGIVFFPAPVLFKKGDNMSIKFYLKNGYQGKHDNLVMLGIVGEAIGLNFNG